MATPERNAHRGVDIAPAIGRWWRGRWAIAIGAGLVVLAVAGIGSLHDDDETSPTTAVADLSSFGSGQQLVGQDVQPGVYTTSGAADSGCYFERLIGLSGEVADIIANGHSVGPVIVEIAAFDVAFNSQGCEDWTAFLGGTPVDSFGDGDWAVGSQIAPGRWSTEGDPSSVGCYWERARGFTHTLDDIVANGNAEGRTIVDIGPNDRLFTVRGCGTWTRVG